MKINKFGKGKTITMMSKKEEWKAFIKKWLPVIFLVIGFGLVVIGILIQIGVIC